MKNYGDVICYALAIANLDNIDLEPAIRVKEENEPEQISICSEI